GLAEGLDLRTLEGEVGCHRLLAPPGHGGLVALERGQGFLEGTGQQRGIVVVCRQRQLSRQAVDARPDDGAEREIRAGRGVRHAVARAISRSTTAPSAARTPTSGAIVASYCRAPYSGRKLSGRNPAVRSAAISVSPNFPCRR